jgi:cell division inhibitor SepF
VQTLGSEFIVAAPFEIGAARGGHTRLAGRTTDGHPLTEGVAKSNSGVVGRLKEATSELKEASSEPLGCDRQLGCSTHPPAFWSFSAAARQTCILVVLRQAFRSSQAQVCGAMESSFGQRVPEVVVMTPDGFAQAVEAVLAVQQQRTVVLHLAGMPADEAQRTIDFVSGGVFAMDGQSERLGEMVFLFAPALVRIQRDRETESP